MSDEPTYKLITDQNGKAYAIECRKCQMQSFNRGDIDNRYCAKCDWMHDLKRRRTLADVIAYQQAQQITW